MAWDEYRNKRDPDRQVTSEISVLPASEGAGAKPPSRHGRDWEGWGQRFGWMVAVGLSVVALLLAGVALVNSGHGARGAGFIRGRGLNGAAAPSFGQGQAPEGLGGGYGYGGQ